MIERARALVAPHTRLGESPLWRESDNTLHYVDVLGQTINVIEFRDSHKRRTILCPEPVTFLGFHRDGGYIVCSFSSIVRVSDEGEWVVLKHVIPDTTTARLNDGGIDSAGRLWVGSIDRIGEAIPKSSPEARRYQPKGSIYRYNPDGTLTAAQEGGVLTGNGMSWSPDNKTMYFTDSYINRVWAYDFDAAAGRISNRRALITREGDGGEADGLLIHSEGNIFTFIWEGAAVMKYSADGKFVRKWDINASRVTHGAWVGPGLRNMVLTSAMADGEDPTWDGEEGGALFYLRDVGTAGVIKHLFG